MKRLFSAAAIAAALTLSPVAAFAQQEPTTILNVSYDIARELYAKINPAFAAAWKAKTGKDITIDQSHAGTSRQARAILEGLQADLVTFNQVTDVQVLHDRGKLIPADWQTKLPNNSSPYYSLPAFLVRKGNPKGVKDWGDLARDGVESVFPNPKTSGNARYSYLGAFAWAKEAYPNDLPKQLDYMKKFFSQVPVFDTGGRASTTTFVEREIGDVLITFEAEVNNVQREFGADKFDVVIPSVSVLAEFPVALVDAVADKRGSRGVATAYLEYLYSEEAQKIIASFYNRVHHPAVVEATAAQFPKVRLVTVEDVFGGWDKAQKEHFAEGGLLDQVFVKR